MIVLVYRSTVTNKLSINITLYPIYAMYDCMIMIDLWCVTSCVLGYYYYYYYYYYYQDGVRNIIE